MNSMLQFLSRLIVGCSKILPAPALNSRSVALPALCLLTLLGFSSVLHADPPQGTINISTEGNHTLFQDLDGSVRGLGQNSNGQLGDGTTAHRAGAVPFQTVSGPMDDAIAISSGTSHSIALKADGTVWTSGLNSSGQLGNGLNSQSTKAVQVLTLNGTLTDIQAIAAGFNHNLALASNGEVWVWGQNASGQLGISSSANQFRAVKVPGLTDVIAISGGDSFSYVLKADGTVWAFGRNTTGQLGNNSTTASNVPVQVKHGDGMLSGVVAISAGRNHGVFLKSDGSVYAVGQNAYGQLGDNTTVQKLKPVQVLGATPGFESIVQISAADLHSVFLKSDGTVWATGGNTFGQIGDGTLLNRTRAVLVPNLTDVAVISAGANRSFAVKSDGVILAWGDDTYGALGTGETGHLTNWTQLPAFSDAAGAASSAMHTLVLKPDGSVWAAGRNNFGQLGNGLTTDSAALVQVLTPTGSLAAMEEVAVGSQHSLGLSTDGSVWAWGSNANGRLGDGTNITRTTAIAAHDASGPLVGIEAIAAGDAFSLALRQGTVLAWGLNAQRQLGDGTTTERRKAVEVQTSSGPLANITAIAAGSAHGVALKNDGTVWTWGLNSSGQLALGNTAIQQTATQVPGITDAIAIAAGAFQTYILRAVDGGTLWAAGQNTQGQLADGTAVNRSSLVQVLGPSGALTGLQWVLGGSLANHASAGGADGTAWIWGSNSLGQLGQPSPLFSNRALALPQALEPMALGAQTSYATRDATDWFASGARLYGQFADGQQGYLPQPLTIRGMTFAVPAPDADADGTVDWQEISQGSDPDMADADLDGIADASDAYPNDFFNGVPPTLAVLGGSNQSAMPGEKLPAPIVVEVSNGGIRLVNAPVVITFAGGGVGATGTETTPTQTILTRTDDLGRAIGYITLPAAEGEYSVSIQSGGVSTAVPVTAVLPPAKKPPTVPAWVTSFTTTGAAFLKWTPSTDYYGVTLNNYLIFRNGVHVATTPKLFWTDPGLQAANAYLYRVVAKDARANTSSSPDREVTTAATPGLPAEWQAADIGSMALGQGSEAWTEDNLTVASCGTDIMTNHRLIYREFTGDFSLSAKVDLLQPTAHWSKAGLVIMAHLGTGSPKLVYAMSGMADAQVQVRASEGGGSDAMTTPEIRSPGWLRIDRTGSTFTCMASFDGSNWFVTDSLEMELPPTVLLGMAVASGDNRYFCTGVFSDIVFENRLDSDGDGLTDSRELALGSDPYLSDTDGDGLTDFEEASLIFSNPLVADFGDLLLIQSKHATARAAQLGRWAVSGTTLLARDERGWIEYDIEVPTAGVYRLSLEVAELSNPTQDPMNDFKFWVDGTYIDLSRVRLTPGQTAFAQVFTPYLTAGTHRVRILWDNTLTDRRISVHNLIVDTFEDEGWVETRLAALNGISHPATGTISTPVSPLLVEGWARFPETVSVFDESEVEIPALPLPGDTWFAELPLNPEAALTTAEVDFENGAVTLPVEATWVALDVIDPATEGLTLRKGDALKLTVSGVETTRPGTLSIRRASEQTPLAIYALNEGPEDIIHTFAEAGNYVVGGTLSEAPSQPAVFREIPITVKDAQFAPDLTLTLGTPATWTHPALAVDIPVQYDNRLAFTELTPPAVGRSFQVGSSLTRPLWVSARTHENGRLLDTGAVKAIKVSSSMNTSMKVVDALPDGSEIVEMPVLVSDVVPGMTVTLQIVVAGVTFEDGSLTKVLTAADFDELGRAKVRFIRSNGTPTSSCYTLNVTFNNP